MTMHDFAKERIAQSTGTGVTLRNEAERLRARAEELRAQTQRIRADIKSNHQLEMES